MSKVFLDAGHGGTDSGATGNGMLEKVINLDVVLKLGDILKQRGVEVNFSRTTDAFVDLQKRCDMAAAFGAQYFISVHHNSGGGDGAEAYKSVYADGGAQLADNILKEFQTIGQNLRGVKEKWNSTHTEDYYGVLRGLKPGISGILCEFGFIDTSDAQIFNTPDKRIAEATAYAKGILKTLGIAYDVPTPTPAPAPAPQSAPQPVAPSALATLNVVTDLKGYMSADDALKGSNPKTTVHPGSYFIFNTHGGAINVTAVKGQPGSWVNVSLNIGSAVAAPAPQYLPVKCVTLITKWVRSGAGWGYSKVGQVKVPDKYQILSPSNNGWLQIGLNGKPLGWVSASIF